MHIVVQELRVMCVTRKPGHQAVSHILAVLPALVAVVRSFSDAKTPAVVSHRRSLERAGGGSDRLASSFVVRYVVVEGNSRAISSIACLREDGAAWASFAVCAARDTCDCNVMLGEIGAQSLHVSLLLSPG